MKGQKPIEPPISVSPSQKKLKQARLPFMVLGDTTPVPQKVTPKKRNLSPKENDTAKNNLTEDSIVISDDENRSADSETKQLNPYVKLVDTVMKKKSQKYKSAKNSKRTRNDSKKRKSDNTTETDTNTSNVESKILPSENNSEPDLSINFEETNIDKDSDNKSSTGTPESNNNKKRSSSTPNSAKGKSNKRTKINEIKSTNNKTGEVKAKETIEIIDDKSNDTNDIEDIKLNSDEVDKLNSTKVDGDKLNSTMDVDEADPTIDCDKSMTDLKELVGSEADKSNPCTPVRAKRACTEQKDDSLNESLSNLTPKQKQRKLESIKRREEREKEKLEREMKRQQEKEEKDKIKKEKEDQKKKEREEKEEIKRKEREEKEEQRKKEKEEKDKQRDLEKKLREEKEELKKKEREDKEEQRRKEKETRELERKKKQEAQELEKQEQELKKKKAAEAFVNFFVPKQKCENDQPVAGPSSWNAMLSTFAVKSDMRLAPNVRVKLTEDRRSVLDNLFDSQNCDKLYLKSLKNDDYKPESRGKTWPLEDKDECIIIEDELPPLDCAGEMISCESAVRERLRPKLLSFHENRRPPYWGTWRRKSSVVTPRRPFGQDQKVLEYSVDSDDEWEEEAEGESISGSNAGSDVEPEDDYELDNKVFVPHGYLSDEEGTMDGDEMLSLSPETQKARLKLLEDEFESEHKKQTEKLKPRLYGLIWETSHCGKPDNCVDVIWNYFQKLSMIIDDPTPFFKPSQEPDESEKKKSKKRKLAEGEQPSPQSEKRKKSKPSKVESNDKSKTESKKKSIEPKNQRDINCFLTKVSGKDKSG